MLTEPMLVVQSNRLKEFNVLYVDDEFTNLRLFEMAFKRHYNVFLAESGQQAIDVLKNENIQLIVTDQKMPRMTGTELLEKTIDDFPDMIRIILTGYADIEAIIQAVNKCKIYKYITKPYDQSDMKLTLDKALELFKVRMERRGLIDELAKVNGDLEEKVKERTKELEIANQRLTDGLVFAQTIQEFILPNEQELARVFKDAFVIYQPKDFVGGDFFWFKNFILDHRQVSVIAVVDCMGHGVAGALLSMIGETQLNQIVKVNEMPVADLVLSKLDEGLRRSLSRPDSGGHGATMDVALTIIDHESGRLQFSGAKLDLVYIRNGELGRLKGTRKSVGSNWNEDAKFERHTIDIGGITGIYMFSDGFQDQFNAENTKKFGSKKLHELLLSVKSENFANQKQIISQVLSDWRKDLEQVDDITLIGFNV